MRKVVVSMFVSLDGVVENPHLWSLAYWNKQTEAFKNKELFAADALLLGRVTYEGFAASWPARSGDDYTDRINTMPKFVASRTTRALEWKNSTVIGASSNLIDDVRRLKNAGGNELLIFGSSTLIAALIQHDLIDEYRLLVYPVVLGAGQRMFLDGATSRLKLKGSETYGDDVLLLTYEAAR